MRAIIGLGNPGKKYELTRHNVGFLILDSFALKNRLTFKPFKKEFYYSEGRLRSSDFFLVKPTTYMNKSGLAVLDVANKFSLEPEDILVVSDDVNLPTGKIRIRKGGGDGGHNGLKSIIYHLQSTNFLRLRFGIGNKASGDLANYVLDRFTNDELNALKESFSFAVNLIEEFITGGFKTMLDFFSKNSGIINKNDLQKDINQENQ